MMEWLSKLLGDLDEDDRRRFLAVLHAALSFGDADQQACVHVLEEEVTQWAGWRRVSWSCCIASPSRSGAISLIRASTPARSGSRRRAHTRCWRWWLAP